MSAEAGPGQAAVTTGGALFVFAVASMFLVEGLLYVSTMVLPIAAPNVAADLGLDTALLGLYMALLNGTAMITSLFGGGLAARWGGVRLSQICLLISATALALIALGAPALFAVAAMMLGVGQSGSIPASSHVMIRVTPPRLAAFAFSLKQTGVPAAAMTAGLVVPLIAATSGWPAAFLAAAAVCAVLALALQSLRPALDRDRNADASTGLGAVAATLRLVMLNARLRALTLGAASFIGTQLTFATFFITYLVQALDFTLAGAGGVYATSQGIAIVARLLWGWAADRYFAPWRVLGGLGLGMFASAVLTALFTRDWTVTAITAVAVGYALTAFGWNGVLWAEIARAVPAEKVGAVTGGTVSLIFATSMLFPALFGLVLAATESYGIAFVVSAIPALLAGLAFLAPSRAARKP